MSEPAPLPDHRSIVAKNLAMHRVAEFDDGTVLIYIDRILIHDRSGGTILRPVRKPVDRLCRGAAA